LLKFLFGKVPDRLDWMLHQIVLRPLAASILIVIFIFC